MFSPPTRSLARRGLFAAVFGVAASVGCAKDEGCPKPSVCDVLEPGCQRAVMRAVACRRGGRADFPPISVVDEQTLLEMYAERAPLDEEAEASYALWSRGLALFGLAPAEYDLAAAREDTVSETAAVYFPDSKEIVLVDRGESMRSEEAVEVLAHEFVHALQDAEYGFDELYDRWATDFDSALALDALIEGEATHYQTVMAVELAGNSPHAVQWQKFYREWQGNTLLDAERDEAPVALADLRFPYAFGGSFVTQHWLARGSTGIQALFDDPPRSTRDVLFGRSSFDREAELASLRERGVPVLGQGFEPVSSTTLGAWVTRIYAHRMGVRTSDRLEAARDLAADLFSVQVDAANDQVVAAWRVRLTQGNAPQNWPGNLAPFVVSSRDGQTPEERENFRVEGEGLLSLDSALAWQAPMEEAEEGEEEAAAAFRRWRWLKLAGGRACPMGHPALKGEP
jgi:hypothetical protein